MSSKVALAVAAHPDDIEFVMGGTLVLLKEAGYEIHYMNLSSGNGGSMEMTSQTTALVRAGEAKRAAEILGATWHGPVGNDLELVYSVDLLRKVVGEMRVLNPSVVLTHSPQDYMEDHTNTCRLAVSAAFSKGVPNFRSEPIKPAVQGKVTVYHAMPHGLRDPLRRKVIPGAFVDTTSVHATKREALAAHASQKEWLDTTQGMDSYLVTMDEMSQEVGRMSGKFEHAEGWRRHLHHGFCGPDDDPLQEALGERFLVNEEYERGLG